MRAAKGREIVKVGKGMWGLSEWYPKQRPQEVEEERSKRPEPTRKKAGSIAGKRRPPKATARAKSGNASTQREKGKGPSSLILDVLQGASGKAIHVKDITAGVNAKGDESTRATIEGQLNRWAKQGRVKKTAPVTFSLSA